MALKSPAFRRKFPLLVTGGLLALQPLATSYVVAAEQFDCQVSASGGWDCKPKTPTNNLPPRPVHEGAAVSTGTESGGVARGPCGIIDGCCRVAPIADTGSPCAGSVLGTGSDVVGVPCEGGTMWRRREGDGGEACETEMALEFRFHGLVGFGRRILSRF